MATNCEQALAAYDAANRDVKEQKEEINLWAAAAGISVTALLAALAAAIALLGTGSIEAATIVGIPVAVVQAILALLVALVGLLAALSLLASFIALIFNYIQWNLAKSARADAMADIRKHCPENKWPPAP